MNRMTGPRRWLGTVERRTVLFTAGALLLIFAIAVAVKPGFASPGSITTILMLASFAGYVATGQMLVMLTGGIDLSIPWVLNSSAIVVAIVAASEWGNGWIGIGVALVMATVIGVANGLGVAYLGISAVVMTLGMNGMVEGLTLGLTDGLTCALCTSGTPSVITEVMMGSMGGIPRGVLIWGGISVFVAVLLSFSRFGRQVYAIGTNETASFLSGIKTRRTKVILYGLSGLFAGIAGVALSAYGGSPTLGLGNPYMLQSVAVVVVGGISVLGGRGLFAGVFFAAIILTLLLALLQALNMPQYWRDILYGVVLIVILMAYSREKAVR